MYPMLRNRRDMVVLEKPQGRLKKYDIPLYKRATGEYVLHRVMKVREQDYVTCGDNRYYMEFGITDSQILGVVTGFYRDSVYIPVTNRKYRCYVHLVCDFFFLRKFVLRVKCFFRKRRKAKAEHEHV